MLDTFKIGQVSDKTIFAPRYVKYKDTIVSQQLVDEAKNEVQKVYDLDKTIKERVITDLRDFTSSVKEQNKYIRTELPKRQADSKTYPDFVEKDFVEKELKKTDNPFNFTVDELKIFYTLDDDTIDVISDAFENQLNNTLDNKIDEANVEQVRKNFVNNSNLFFINKKIRVLMTDKLSKRIVPNLTFNKAETDLRTKEAVSKVEPVFREVQKGETVIRMGEVVTASHLEKLKNLGLIKTEINYTDMIKTLPYSIFILFVLHIYLFKFHENRFQHVKQYVFLLSTIVFAILLTNVIKDSSFFLIPLLTILMLSVVFWGRQLTLFLSLILGMLINVGEYEYLLLALFSGIFLSLIFKDRGNRIDLILSGILVGIGIGAIYFIFSLLLKTDFSIEKTLFFVSSAFVSSLLTMGFIPLFESMLGIVTSLKLHELHNPNHPLLKRLIREAPGTYHHSLMVGNLAETAADEIGANGLLLRVGAFFHDVGKLKNPEYFIENTTPSRNPHDNIEPIESARIIRRHPLDSVELCKKYNIPEPILKLIISHHGDSVLTHFYKQAVENDGQANVEDFRYETPTPKTKEEGILLLADSIEAYSRVLLSQSNSKEKFEEDIKKAVYSKIHDGTLRHCNLSLKDIDTIVFTFVNYLLNSNHERIAYKK